MEKVLAAAVVTAWLLRRSRNALGQAKTVMEKYCGSRVLGVVGKFVHPLLMELYPNLG